MLNSTAKLVNFFRDGLYLSQWLHLMEARLRPLPKLRYVAEVFYGCNGDSTFTGTVYAYSGVHGTMYVLGKHFSCPLPV